MHPNIKIRVISLVKYHLSKMMKLKLLEQILHQMQRFYQLEDTLFIHKQVSNMSSQMFSCIKYFSNNIINDNCFCGCL